MQNFSYKGENIQKKCKGKLDLTITHKEMIRSYVQTNYKILTAPKSQYESSSVRPWRDSFLEAMAMALFA